MNKFTDQAIIDSRMLTTTLNDTIRVFASAFRGAKDPEFAALLNDVTPALIAARLKLEHFIEVSALNATRHRVQKTEIPKLQK